MRKIIALCLAASILTPTAVLGQAKVQPLPARVPSTAIAIGAEGGPATVVGPANPLPVTMVGGSTSTSDATAANQTETNRRIGDTSGPTAGTTNGRLLTINNTLGSPFQAGGSIANTAFGISGTLPAFATTPTFNLGTAPTLSIIGVAGGTPVPVTGTFSLSGSNVTSTIDQSADGTSNNVQTSPTTLTYILDSSAATTNAVLITATTRTLKMIMLTQTSANADCFTAYNTGTTPTAGANANTRIVSWNIPAVAGVYTFSAPSGIYASTGLAFTITRGVCSATGNTALAAGEITSLNVFYR